jgi:predicted nucleic acid-binding Zn ribbon protein
MSIRRFDQRAADDAGGELEEFARRGQMQRRRFHGGQPKAVADVLAQLVQRKGYAQIRSARAGAEAWRAAAGERFAAVTEMGQVRRGVLEVTAANSLVVQELTFEKERLLAAMQQALPDAGIKHLRFRVGQIG